MLFNRIQNPFNKPSILDSSRHYIDCVTRLLDSLLDDDVKTIAEASLIKIADKKPDEIVLFICDYKKRNPKLAESIIAVTLR